MIYTVCNKKIDFIGEEPLFTTRLNAIYQLECDSNYAIYIGHTINDKLEYALEDLINQAKNRVILAPMLSKSINRSQVLTVTILYIQEPSNYLSNTAMYKQLLAKKYELIEKLKSYEPYGLNNLIHILQHEHTSECSFAKNLIKLLSTKNERYYTKVNANAKKVYQYSRSTGLFIREYTSVTEAAARNNLTVSSITNCCANRTKTAGGFVWRYEKAGLIEIPKDNRLSEKKVRMDWLTPKQRAELIEERAKKFMKDHDTL